MNQFILGRAENLLLLSPFLFLFLLTCFLPGQTVFIPLPGDELSVSQIEMTLLWMIFVSIPYLFHYGLRQIGKRDAALSWLHIMLSFLIMMLLAVAYYNVPLISRDWSNALFPLPQYIKWQEEVRLVRFLWQTFLLIQLFFILYALFLFFQKSKNNYAV